MKFQLQQLFFSLAIFTTILLSCKKEDPAPPAIEEPSPAEAVSLILEMVASNLQIPWGFAQLPDGRVLCGERNGRISIFDLQTREFKTIYNHYVWAIGEGGLLGLAVDPDYRNNSFIYVYETLDSNRVRRLRITNDVVSAQSYIVRGIPASQNHDGGALKFGPDGYLYIGTGDALKPQLAQDRTSYSGKILRVDRDGNPPPGNPFNTRVWSYGHRNVQGFAWTSDGTMLATEHGPSGEFNWFQHDEINRIMPGKNYGWPIALAGTEKDTLVPPIYHSGDESWAPSGCAWLGSNSIWPNTLVVACLNGQRIMRLKLSATNDAMVFRTDTFIETFKRLRSVTPLADGSLMFSTSNLGNINSPAPFDDRIFRLSRP
jgi:glucose/arabinose dehydrogenase